MLRFVYVERFVFCIHQMTYMPFMICRSIAANAKKVTEDDEKGGDEEEDEDEDDEDDDDDE